MERTEKCTSCGCDLLEGAKFCSQCGVEQKPQGTGAEPTDMYCTGCGAELTPTAVFCSACGQKRASRASKARNGKVVRDWVKHSLVLLIAVLFVSVAFLPIVRMSVKESGVKFTLKLSAIDSIALCFHATQMLTEEELTEELGELLMDKNVLDLEDLELNLLANRAMRFAIQSEEVSFKPQYVLTALLAFLYLMASIAFFAFSAIEFVFFCLGRKRPKLFRAVVQMLCAIPILAIVTGIAISFSFVPGGLSGSVIALVAMSLAVIAYFAIDHYFLGETKIKPRAGAIVKRSLSVVVCAMMMLSICFPVVTYKAKTVFANREERSIASRPLDVRFFENFALSESQIKVYDEELKYYENTDCSVIQSYTDAYSFFTRRDFEKGEANELDGKILTTAFLSAGIYEVGWLVSLSTILSILVSLIGGILLWQNFVALVSDASPRRFVTIPLKALGVLAAAMLLALMIVFVAVGTHNIEMIDFANAKLSLSIAAGAILSVIFSLMVAIVPMRKRK